MAAEENSPTAGGRSEPSAVENREAGWRRHYAAWRASGLTRKRYALDNGLTYPTLTMWFRCIAAEADPGGAPDARVAAPASAAAAQTPVIVPITVPGDERMTGARPPFRLHIRSGLGLEIPADFSGESLARLLDCLGVPR
jgi:hypothetical protein